MGQRFSENELGYLVCMKGLSFCGKPTITKSSFGFHSMYRDDPTTRSFEFRKKLPDQNMNYVYDSTRVVTY